MSESTARAFTNLDEAKAAVATFAADSKSKRQWTVFAVTLNQTGSPIYVVDTSALRAAYIAVRAAGGAVGKAERAVPTRKTLIESISSMTTEELSQVRELLKKAEKKAKDNPK